MKFQLSGYFWTWDEGIETARAYGQDMQVQGIVGWV